MHVPQGAVGADVPALRAHLAAVGPPGEHLSGSLRDLVELAERWNVRTVPAGARLDVAALVDVQLAAAALRSLDLWVAQVAAAFARTDIASPDGRAWLPARSLDALGPPPSAPPGEQCRGAGLVVVERSRGATRVVRLVLDDPAPDVGPDEWRSLVRAAGIDGRRGPVHLVVHGWGTTTAGAVSAGRATADLYDEQAVAGATVVVVDWAAGEGAGGLGTLGDFARAEAAVGPTGDALARVLGALAEADAQVTVTAHSLGVGVVARALGGLDDAPDTFGVDLLAIQPAMPAAAPGALASGRVRELTLTVNDGDDALFWYELRGPDALGDEAPDGEALGALVDRRRAAGLPTEVVDHDSSAGHGHLGLRPDGSQGLVRSLTQEAIDRSTGDPAAQTALRRWIETTWSGPPDDLADALIDHPEVEAYLSRCQRDGIAPRRAVVRMLAAQLAPAGPAAPAGTTTTVPR